MLTTRNENSEKAMLERISLARNPSEPQVEPTEEIEQEPVEKEIDEKPEEAPQEQDEETEELDDEPESQEEPDEELYIDLDGEEIALSQVKEWKEGNLRQSDYTKKTTEAAKVKKQADEMVASSAKLQADLEQKIASVNAILQQETLTSEQLQELKEDDPEEYINYSEKLKQRQEIVNSVKAPAVDRAAVNEALVKANPHWVEEGKPTEKFNQDMAMVREYTAELGYSNQELAGIEQNGDAHHWLTLIDAARGKAAIKRLAEIEGGAAQKRTRKAPTVTKPRGKGQTNIERQIEAAKTKFKRTGHPDDAYAYRKLIKQREK
jgi:hypothetical protein